MAGNIMRMVQMRNGCKIMVENLEEKRPFGRPSRRWKVSIKMEFNKRGYEDVDLFHFILDRNRWRTPVYTVIELRVTKSARSFFSEHNVSFSTGTLEC